MGGELGDLVAEAIELLVALRGRVSMHGEPSFYWSDSTPRVSHLLGAREAGDLVARNDFSLRPHST
jgi:hypothetical protein